MVEKPTAEDTASMNRVLAEMGVTGFVAVTFGPGGLVGIRAGANGRMSGREIEFFDRLRNVLDEVVREFSGNGKLVGRAVHEMSVEPCGEA